MDFPRSEVAKLLENGVKVSATDKALRNCERLAKFIRALMALHAFKWKGYHVGSKHLELSRRVHAKLAGRLPHTLHDLVAQYHQHYLVGIDWSQDPWELRIRHRTNEDETWSLELGGVELRELEILLSEQLTNNVGPRERHYLHQVVFFKKIQEALFGDGAVLERMRSKDHVTVLTQVRLLNSSVRFVAHEWRNRAKRGERAKLNPQEWLLPDSPTFNSMEDPSSTIIRARVVVIDSKDTSNGKVHIERKWIKPGTAHLD
ncbi:MAG: hypothetical protein KDD66_16325 [Bdellovibrionales bacterium]|nr:hypothetical protein [Bdellovibrionales bacterium]